MIVYSDFDLEIFDLQGVANSAVEIRKGKPEIDLKSIGIKPQMKFLGPKFKDKSGKILSALNSMNPSEVARQKANGSIMLCLDSEILEIAPDAVEIMVETFSEGEAVDILKVGDASVLVKR